MHADRIAAAARLSAVKHTAVLTFGLFFFLPTSTRVQMAKSIVWLASQAGRLDELAQLPLELLDRVTMQRSLYAAIVNNHAGIVRFLLQAGAAIGKNAHLLQTALHTAARHDSADALRALIEANAGLNDADADRRSAVVTAVEHGATACLRVLLLAKAALETTNQHNYSPVCAAARNGDVSMLHLLLQHKASMDMRGPIASAARNGHVGAVHVLFLAKADIDSTDYHGCTPLIAAARSGHVAVMLLLLQAKADAMHCIHISDWSALSSAASAGHTAAVRCLLQHAPALAAVVTREWVWTAGGSVPAGSTPLDIARRFQHADVVALLVAATASAACAGPRDRGDT